MVHGVICFCVRSELRCIVTGSVSPGIRGAFEIPVLKMAARLIDSDRVNKT